jgi:hypothetical protein
MLTAAAQGHITRAPWAGIFPGLAIFVVVLGFNLLGDALRDVLEPREHRAYTSMDGTKALPLEGTPVVGTSVLPPPVPLPTASTTGSSAPAGRTTPMAIM